MSYILQGPEKSEECIFCAFPAQGPDRFRENLILHCDDAAFVILNRFPYNNGHLMVVPRRHLSDPADLSAAEYQACAERVRWATGALRRALHPAGFNIGMNLGRVAGAGIDRHCHWHVVPRWDGDTNFMPVVAEVKVMGEHLQQSFERLAPFFRAPGGDGERQGA
jgi:ATP adenylyltransferase